MKSLLLVLVCVICFFTVGVVTAQDYPEVTVDEENMILTIPYLETEGAEGETLAFSVELSASLDGGELLFKVNEETLLAVEEDSPKEIEGDGACSQSTDSQNNACEAGVKDSYFNTLAKCFNYSDSEVREECIEDAVDERVEGFEECEDIEEARDYLCAVFGEDPYDPEIDPGNFLSLAQIIENPNPYLPLLPGNEWVYESEDETITVTVLDETREIMGVEAVVVRDVEEEDGELIEDTFDWFAQDIDGNVWYMGELSRNYEDGELSDIDGSWEAGVDGAKPGIIFRAMPIIGELYRQEFLIGEAGVVGLTESVTADESTEAGFDCENSCLLTFEGSPLEPDELEAKYYIPGVGHILTIDLEEDEREELVSFTPAD